MYTLHLGNVFSCDSARAGQLHDSSENSKPWGVKVVSLISRVGHGKQMFEAWVHLLQSIQPDRMVVDERGENETK